MGRVGDRHPPGFFWQKTEAELKKPQEGKTELRNVYASFGDKLDHLINDPL